MNHSPERIAEAITILADVLAAAIAARADDAQGDLVGVDQTPLTPRRWNALCRKRQAAGQAGVVVAGRRYFLSREAWSEEMGQLDRPRKSKDPDGLERLHERLRLVGGAG